MARAVKVSQLPTDPGPAAWNCLLPDPDPPMPLGEDTRADWLVVGAGFAGLAAARRLSQLDPTGRIVVLEAKRVAEGPAGRNSGFMIDLPHDLSSADYGGVMDRDRAQTAANRHAIAFAADMARAFDLPVEAFAQSGKINAAVTAKGDAHNRAYAQHLDAMGEAYEVYGAEKMRAITGTSAYRSGLFTPGTAMIQPAMFVRGVARGLASNRVRIVENAPVTSLAQDGDWIATTPQGQVRAPKVILAVNGHLQSFGFAQNQLMHVFTYASMTRALSAQEVETLGGEPVWGVTPADPMGTTVRRISGQGGDRIVVRNRFTFDPSMMVDDRRITAVGRDHDRAFAARFPMLQGVGMEYRWGGRLCVSRNNVQVVGAVAKGLYAACCQNGLGTAQGTLAGLAAAELAAGQPSDFAKTLQGADAPSRVLPGFATNLAANGWLRMQEWRAGAEL